MPSIIVKTEITHSRKKRLPSCDMTADEFSILWMKLEMGWVRSSQNQAVNLRTFIDGSGWHDRDVACKEGNRLPSKPNVMEYNFWRPR